MRVFRRSIKRNCVSIFLCNLFLLLGMANGEASTNDILMPIIELLKNSNYNFSGAGSSQISITNNGKKEEKRQDFKFKNTMALTSTSVLKGSDWEHEKTWFTNSKGDFSYHDTVAVIQAEPYFYYNCKLGFDFRPETFNRIHGIPIGVILEKAVESDFNIKITFEKDGLVKISGKSVNDKNHQESLEIVLDSNKGYLLKSWKDTRTGDGDYQCIYSSEWEENNGQYFIKSATFSEEFGGNTEQNATSYQISMRTKEFQANLEIPDSDFSFQGINMHSDTLIVDQISGITYKFNSTPLRMADLEKPLLRAEFTEKLAVKSEDAKLPNNIQDVSQDEVIRQGAGKRPGNGDLSSSKKVSPVVISITVIIVILVAGIIYKRNKI